MSGIRYFFRGLGLISEPGIRGFVLFPVLINLLIFSAVTWFLLGLTDDFTTWVTGALGDWVESFLWLVWLVLGLLWLILYGYSFSIISNSIAAPFYGLLAERVQAKVTGKAPDEPLNLRTFLAMVKRTMIREWQKLLYILPRLLGLLVVSIPLSFIPVIGMVVPALWFIWSAWSLSLQNLDYAADNNLVTFPDMKTSMKKHRVYCLSFGSAVAIAAAIPVFNLLAIPAAVAGGTALWLEQWPDTAKTDLKP